MKQIKLVMLLKDIIKKANGEICYDDLSNIDISLGIKSNINNLKEDLLQIKYSNDLIIDVGWYPSFNLKGTFHVCIIKDFDWDTPIVKKKCKSFEELGNVLSELMCGVPNGNF